jgi:hypothetical protein
MAVDREIPEAREREVRADLAILPVALVAEQSGPGSIRQAVRVVSTVEYFPGR